MKRSTKEKIKLGLADLNRRMEEKLLFNSNIEEEEIEVIFGNNTNLLVLENPKFPWAVKLYDDMVAARWTKEDVSMISDPITYNKLNPDQQFGYDITLSFLAFLDSLQVNNLGSNVSAYITAPEIVGCFAEQGAIEFQHSYIYQHIFQSLKLKTDEILAIYYKWKDVPILKERIEYISKIYQDFQDKPTLKNFFRALIADLLLEGLYFYNGFAFMYLLASAGLVMGTSGNIKLINKDELFHTVLFQNTIREIMKLCDVELRTYFYKELFEMTEIALKQEVEWSIFAYGNGKNVGVTNKSINEYTTHLAVKNIIRPIFGKDNEIRSKESALEVKYQTMKLVKNPYGFVSKIANLDGGESKNGFFENSNVDYLTTAVFKDYGDF